MFATEFHCVAYNHINMYILAIVCIINQAKREEVSLSLICLLLICVCKTSIEFVALLSLCALRKKFKVLFVLFCILSTGLFLRRIIPKSSLVRNIYKVKDVVKFDSFGRKGSTFLSRSHCWFSPHTFLDSAFTFFCF